MNKYQYKAIVTLPKWVSQVHADTMKADEKLVFTDLQNNVRQVSPEMMKLQGKSVLLRVAGADNSYDFIDSQGNSWQDEWLTSVVEIHVV